MITVSIGSAAQSALQPLRGGGGPAYLDDGRCAAWVQVANTSRGPGNWWSGGGSNYVAQNVPMPSGTVCQMKDAWDRGERIFTLDAGSGWGVIVQPSGGWNVKPKLAVTAPWKTRAKNAVRNALTLSPGPRTTSFAPLAGTDLPNTYRSK